MEDSELSRLLHDLASSDPAFESSLAVGAMTEGARVGVLAEALPGAALQASPNEAVAQLLRISIFPRILDMCKGSGSWNKGIHELRIFEAVHGMVLMPMNYVSLDGFKLGNWVRDKRVAKTRGKLSSNQIKELDDLGFVWDVYEHQWQQGIHKLHDYKTENGEILVPMNYVSLDGFKLGNWVRDKRVAKTRGKLSSNQIKELDDLGFVWDVYEHQRQQGIHKLHDYKTENGDILVPMNYVSLDGFKLGNWVRGKRVAKSRGKLSSNQIKELDDLGFVWDVYEHQWQQGIHKLHDYKTENGNISVPQTYETSDGFKLGNWVNCKRVAKTRGKLSSNQIKELDDLGFVWDAHGHQWQQGIHKLRDYKTENGDILVPKNHETSDGFKLGMWVTKRRAAKSKGKLSSHQINELDDFGFVWDVAQHQWQQGIYRLCAYKTENGDILVPKNYETSDGFKLGNWVIVKRVAKSKGKLSSNHIKELDDLGFVWDVYEHQWHHGIHKLHDYKSENGNISVPQTYETPDGFKLGNWVRDKRVAKLKGKLSSHQIKELDDLGFVWDVYEHQRQQGIHKLYDYKSENGNILVPQTYETSDGFKLGMWVAKRRAAKSKGKLSSHQIKEIDDLGFVWDVYEHQWQQVINKLHDYKSENGDLLVPFRYQSLDGFKLGMWVRDKRVAKLKGKLSSHRIKELDDLGFVWDAHGHQWQQGIHKLRDYKSENGNILVPQTYETSDGFKLGMWVAKRRAAKSKGKLSRHEIKELDDLGFVWDVYEHQWQQVINKLHDYKSENGNLLVPFRYQSLDGFKLGNWVSIKRVAKSRGKLSSHRIEELDDLGFVWDVHDYQW